jgi:transcriptional regulator with XRE-family HTH domain
MLEESEIEAVIGSRIRMRRKELGITQETLSKAIGVSYQQLQKYERGSNRINAGKLFLVASTLRVSIEYFFDGLDQWAESNGDALLSTLRRHEVAQCVKGLAAVPSQDVKSFVIPLISRLGAG